MGDLGLDTAYGAEGSSDAMQQIFQRRMAAAASARQQQQLDQTDALTRLKIQEQADEIRQRLEGQKQAARDRVDAAKAADQDRQDKQAAGAFAMNPVGSDLGPTAGPRAQQLGFPVTKIAGPQVQQTAGFMPLPSAPSQGPGMQALGGLTPVDGPQAPAGQSTTSADASSPLNAPATFTRGATQADLVKQREDQQKGDTADWQNSIRQELASLKEGQGGGAKDHFVAQDRYDSSTGKPVAGTLNTSTGAWTAHPEQGSLHAPVGAAAEAKTQAEAAKASNAIGQLDQSLDSVKDMVGAAAGRGETVEQWLGTADPKIQAFGTKLLMTKLIIDKAITGSARAGASPSLIARWDNLLSNKVSYDGMKAALKAANEIVGGGAKPAGGVKLSAEDLIKKYGGQ